jgi:hypothetical protein
MSYFDGQQNVASSLQQVLVTGHSLPADYQRIGNSPKEIDESLVALRYSAKRDNVRFLYCVSLH